MTFSSPGISIISSFLLRIDPEWYSELILDPCSIDLICGTNPPHRYRVKNNLSPKSIIDFSFSYLTRKVIRRFEHTVTYNFFLQI